MKKSKHHVRFAVSQVKKLRHIHRNLMIGAVGVAFLLIVVIASAVDAVASVSDDRCFQVKEWFDEGILTDEHPEAYPDAEFCAEQKSDIWGGLKTKTGTQTQTQPRRGAAAEVTESRCKEVKKWFDAETLTSQHSNALNDADQCASKFKAIWAGVDAGGGTLVPRQNGTSVSSVSQKKTAADVTEKQCRDIKKWFDQDVLTQSHSEFEDAAEVCVKKFADLWQGKQKIPEAAYEDEIIENFAGYKNAFPDTDLNSLSGMAAAELFRRDIISGYKDGEFKGSRPVNRAEAARFLLQAKNEDVDTALKNNSRFADVFEDQWYIPYIMTAAKLNVIAGYPDGSFKPGNPVGTAEFLVMLAKLFDLETNLDYSYEDVEADQWFAAYAGIAERYELFPERSTNLEPGRKLTRFEVAVALYQYLRNR